MDVHVGKDTDSSGTSGELCRQVDIISVLKTALLGHFGRFLLDFGGRAAKADETDLVLHIGNCERGQGYQ